MDNLSLENKLKVHQFELQEAKWAHETVIAPHLYHWVESLLFKIMRGQYGLLGRLFQFLVEYIYVERTLGISLQRNHDRTILSGKGFRPGFTQTRIDQVRTTVLAWGNPVAYKAFPLSIITNQTTP